MSVIVKRLREGDIPLRKAIYSKVIIAALYTVADGSHISARPTPGEDRVIRRTLKSLKEAGYLRMIWVGPRKVKFLPTQNLLDEMEKVVAELHNRPARQLLVERLYKRLKSLYKEAQDEDRNDKGNIH